MRGTLFCYFSPSCLLGKQEVKRRSVGKIATYTIYIYTCLMAMIVANSYAVNRMSGEAKRRRPRTRSLGVNVVDVGRTEAAKQAVICNLPVIHIMPAGSLRASQPVAEDRSQFIQ